MESVPAVRLAQSALCFATDCHLFTQSATGTRLSSRDKWTECCTFYKAVQSGANTF